MKDSTRELIQWFRSTIRDKREKTVLTLLNAGYKPRDIAQEMVMPPPTVYSIISLLKRKGFYIKRKPIVIKKKDQLALRRQIVMSCARQLSYENQLTMSNLSDLTGLSKYYLPSILTWLRRNDIWTFRWNSYAIAKEMIRGIPDPNSLRSRVRRAVDSLIATGKYFSNKDVLDSSDFTNDKLRSVKTFISEYLREINYIRDNKYDQLDDKILSTAMNIAVDGRVNISKLTSMLDVSEWAVRTRVNELRSQGRWPFLVWLGKPPTPRGKLSLDVERLIVAAPHLRPKEICAMVGVEYTPVTRQKVSQFIHDAKLRHNLPVRRGNANSLSQNED